MACMNWLTAPSPSLKNGWLIQNAERVINIKFLSTYWFIAGSDYEEVAVRLNLDRNSNDNLCFNIVILDDSVFEFEENFILTLKSLGDAAIRTINASVIIESDDGMLMEILCIHVTTFNCSKFYFVCVTN